MRSRAGSGAGRTARSRCASPAEAGDVVAARPVRAERNVHEPAPVPAGRRTCCGAVIGLPNVFLSQPGAAAGPGVPEAPARKIWSVARFVCAADVEHGDLSGRVAACLEAGEQRRGCRRGPSRARPRRRLRAQRRRRRRRRRGGRCALSPRAWRARTAYGGGAARCSWRHRRRRRQPRSNGRLTAVRKRLLPGCYNLRALVEFAILGPLEARETDEPIQLGGPKQRALLAMLLLEAGRVVSQDRSRRGAVGRRSRRPTAVASLQNFVAQLSKALGPDVIETRPPGYVVRLEPEQLDVARVPEPRRRRARERAGAARGAARRRARPVARRAAGGVPLRGVRAGGDRAPRGVPPHARRGAGRGEARDRRARRGRRRARGARPRASAARAAARPAHARPLSLGPAGGGARGLPRGTRAARRGAGPRAEPAPARRARVDPPPGDVRGRPRRDPRGRALRGGGRGAARRQGHRRGRLRLGAARVGARAALRRRRGAHRSSRASRRPSPSSTARARSTTRCTRSSRETASRRPSIVSSPACPRCCASARRRSRCSSRPATSSRSNVPSRRSRSRTRRSATSPRAQMRGSFCHIAPDGRREA